LAGAGKTASVLYEATSDVKGAAQKPYEIMGIGVWNPADQSTLAHLLKPRNGVGQTHHRLTYPQAKEPPDAHLFNVGVADKSEPVCMTTRVIRIYQQTGQEYDLMDRIDWELPHAGERSLDTDFLDERLKPHLKNVAAVVIKDMAKGVIDKKLISWLSKTTAHSAAGNNTMQPAWFVSSKEWEPDWYAQLPSAAVRLLIVPQVAAHSAFEKSGFSRWIAGDQSVTKEGLDRINSLATKFPNALICVLPIGLQVIARANCSEGKAFLFQQPVAGEGLHAVAMPMASVFLPTMVSLLLQQGGHAGKFNGLSKEDCQEILTSALSFTEAWMHEEVKRITDAKKWEDNYQKLILSASGLRRSVPDAERPLFPRWTRAEWEESVKSWRKAYDLRGVIPHENHKEEYGVLEVRRAMVEVNGYVCCVESKRRVLRLLSREMQQFHPDFGNWKAFMLKAPPGAGKSYLVNKLADSYGFNLLQFNITSMVTRNDLLDCFDTIVTTQAREKGKKFLIFFDEIDSDLDKHSVYDAFLRPLEEGLYVRAGKAFLIGPCIWIFAGTRDPSSREEELQSAAGRKGSDFISRLSALPLPFDITWNRNDEFKKDGLERLENVYAGATLIKRGFPDVTHVSEAVLDIFRVIPPATGVRKIDRFVKRLDEVQYGRVSMKNVPIDWKDDLEVSPRGVSNWDRDFASLRNRMIRIV
jgi:predicted AAA+ superfamily ATPase